MKVSRAEWENLSRLIGSLGDAEEDLKCYASLTSDMIFKKKNMLEQLDYFINELEELERSMEIPK